MTNWVGVLYPQDQLTPQYEGFVTGHDPAPGDDAWVMGFPRGGPLRVTTGRVVDEVDGGKYEVGG